MEFPFYKETGDERALMFSVFLRDGKYKSLQYFGLADVTGLGSYEMHLLCNTCIIEIKFNKGFAKNENVEDEDPYEIETNTIQAIRDFHNRIKQYQITEIHEIERFTKINILIKNEDGLEPF